MKWYRDIWFVVILAVVGCSSSGTASIPKTPIMATDMAADSAVTFTPSLILSKSPTPGTVTRPASTPTRVATASPRPRQTTTATNTAVPFIAVLPKLNDLIMNVTDFTSRSQRIDSDFTQPGVSQHDDVDLPGIYCQKTCLRRQFTTELRSLTIILAETSDVQAADNLVAASQYDFEPMTYDYREWLLPMLRHASPSAWIMVDSALSFSLATSYDRIFVLVRQERIRGSDDGGGQALNLVGIANLQIEKIERLTQGP